MHNREIYTDLTERMQRQNQTLQEYPDTAYMQYTNRKADKPNHSTQQTQKQQQKEENSTYMLDDSRTTSAKTWNNNHTIVRISKGTRGQNNTKICHCHSYKKSIIPILRLTIYKHTTLKINCKIKMKSDRHGMSVKNPCLLLLTEVKSQNTIQILKLLLQQKKKKNSPATSVVNRHDTYPSWLFGEILAITTQKLLQKRQN